jgi:hypothetical protein
MTTADNESGSTGGRQSDSENLDLIAAYVRDQRKGEKSWTQQLGRFTVYLALAAFFFGIGTLSDLRNRIAPPPLSPAEMAKNSYVGTLDEYCKGFTGARPSEKKSTGWARIAADDLAVLTTRNKMNLAWTTYPVPGDMAPKDVGAFQSIRSYYVAASDLLQAAVARANAGDRDGYALDVGLYRQTNAAFLKAASDFGFTVCDHSWAVDDVPRP